MWHRSLRDLKNAFDGNPSQPSLLAHILFFSVIHQPVKWNPIKNCGWQQWIQLEISKFHICMLLNSFLCKLTPPLWQHACRSPTSQPISILYTLHLLLESQGPLSYSLLPFSTFPAPHPHFFASSIKWQTHFLPKIL